MRNFIEFLSNHMAHAAPILIAGAIALALIIERAYVLFWLYPLADQKTFMDRIRSYMMTDRLADAVALCDYHGNSPVAQVVKEGILRAHLPEEMIEDGLHLVVGEQSQAIQKRTSFLAMIANVATLLGLFGTIAGLISSFEAVGSADPARKSELLAQGISAAMNATMLGLGVAIPAMVAFSFLMNKSNRMTTELDHASVRILDLIRHRIYRPVQSPVKKPYPVENRREVRVS